MIYNGKKYEGVSAHNSAVSGETKDSYADRLWLMVQILTRRDKVISTKKVFTSFKELVSGVPLSHQPETRKLRMDFDMKRKPIRDSFTTDRVVIKGVEYEIAHFLTEPFENVDEFRLYRAKKELCTVLRTEADWQVFWQKLLLKDTNIKVRDLDWAILNSCIIGHRAGFWHISGLEGKSVKEKCDWINSHNNSEKSLNSRIGKMPEGQRDRSICFRSSLFRINSVNW